MTPREFAEANGQPKPKKDNRKNLGKRTHAPSVHDYYIYVIAKWWIKKVSHADNPEIWDALMFRKELAWLIEQDLSPICLFWLRNEWVAIRKRFGLTKGSRKRLKPPPPPPRPPTKIEKGVALRLKQYLLPKYSK